MSRRSSRRFRLRAPSPALIVACVALFVALGGAAWAAGLKNNEVKTRNIAKKAVTSGKLATGAAKTAKIRDGAVTAIKLASNAVTTDSIADSAVTKKKIKAQAVTTPKIGAGAVTDAKLADGAVTGGKIASGAVDGGKLADGAVSASKLADGAVTSSAVLTAFTEEVNIGNLAPGTCQIDEFAAPGVQPGDSVIATATAVGAVNEPTVLSNALAADDEVSLKSCNVGTANTDPDPNDYRFLVIR